MKLATTGRLLAFSLCLGLPLAALAQDQRAAATQAPPAAAQPARRAPHLTPEQMMQRVEAHLTRLHSQLGITAAHDTQWQDFAKVTRDNAAAMRQRFTQRGTHLAQMSAADNMMDFAQISEQHAQEQLRLATSFRALYDAMSPEQRQRADVIFRTPRQPRQRGPRPS